MKEIITGLIGFAVIGACYWLFAFQTELLGYVAIGFIVLGLAWGFGKVIRASME